MISIVNVGLGIIYIEMMKKVLGLSQSFNDHIKNLTLLSAATTTSREMVEHTLKSCKIYSPYGGDICLTYRDHEDTDVAYMVSPMPAACYRLVQEVCMNVGNIIYVGDK